MTLPSFELTPQWRDEHLVMIRDCRERLYLFDNDEREFLETMHIRATWARRPSPEQSQRLEALWDRATEEE